ncbi:MAG TPA: LPS export ABC transporter ATP-binding protein [Candidatus Aminicenantes bacterium]|jgi:ABC-type (unclassified) transport system, ATPase component|nr:LPS export ABC transporter ATP-binding protein [Acidobacteriota bacterium]OQB58348.1 MAG: Lipopolysaccharide export system ATP-binding protein LptB [Candidatus Aminicenantes bacterium ADurb.Bin147]HNQ80835.1 LPS export ABC transporter ATP-binding protein [Candidatus Aminicenantes bacterium]HNT32425.1 LPS export ABC transporter ATP-binding protein [Candidatus Aminicenantes bacterium]HOY98568.1 LPS export ABC transporter ATP-binding protein [Candidatus Aminicenantes bacterium]
MSRLEARRLVKRYGRRIVVKGVDAVFESGEIVGLLGRNGAGKTTFFQMIVGLLRPDAGAVYLDGENMTSLPTDRRARAGLTYLPQENSVFLKASVIDNLRLGLELQPLSRAEREATAAALLEEFNLSPLAAQGADSLSGGERRRLEICRALLLQPKFLLLDEPFTGIDPLTIREIQKTLLRLKERGIGIILSDHNVRDTFQIVDRAYLIDDGEILVMDTPARLAANPKARERFLGTEFRFGEERAPGA